jgi:penicillin-binding protein 2
VGQKKELSKKFKEKNVTTIDPQYYEIMVEGMRGAVEAGTASNARVKDINICGKTGTAQNPHGEDHSVFVCFAPMYYPKIAVAVIVENGGFGNTWSAPIASLMIEKYLNDSTSRPDLEKRMLEGVVVATERRRK